MTSSFLSKLWWSIKNAISPAAHTSAWLLKLLIPISLGVCLLQYFGVIEWIAGYTKPLFQHVGLPGEAAVPFVTGALTGTYGGLASMMALQLTLREATILTLMILVCHALPMESAVVAKTGSSATKMTILRIVMAFLCALLLTSILPPVDAPFAIAGGAVTPKSLPLPDTLLAWLWQVAKLSLMVVLIIFGLMILQRLLEAYDAIRKISRSLGPLMSAFGLPKSSAFLWLVGNVLGISYGSAVMLDLQKQGLLSRKDADEANHHLVMNHSMVEDTILFSAVGISAAVILLTRLTLALGVVWGRRGLLFLWRKRTSH